MIDGAEWYESSSEVVPSLLGSQGVGLGRRAEGVAKVTALRIGVVDPSCRHTEHRVAATVELRRVVRLVTRAWSADKHGEPSVGYWRMVYWAIESRERHEAMAWLAKSNEEVR